MFGGIHHRLSPPAARVRLLRRRVAGLIAVEAAIAAVLLGSGGYLCGGREVLITAGSSVQNPNDVLGCERMALSVLSDHVRHDSGAARFVVLFTDRKPFGDRYPLTWRFTYDRREHTLTCDFNGFVNRTFGNVTDDMIVGVSNSGGPLDMLIHYGADISTRWRGSHCSGSRGGAPAADDIRT